MPKRPYVPKYIDFITGGGELDDNLDEAIIVIGSDEGPYGDDPRLKNLFSGAREEYEGNSYLDDEITGGDPLDNMKTHIEHSQKVEEAPDNVIDAQEESIFRGSGPEEEAEEAKYEEDLRLGDEIEEQAAAAMEADMDIMEETTTGGSFSIADMIDE